MKPIVLALLVAVATAGCGGPSADDGTADADQAAGHDGEHTALRDAVQEPLDRARAVEDLAAGRKDELDEAMEGAEGN